MPTKISSATVARARNLRRNMTLGEQRLWRELRQFKRLYGLHVRKQVPIGPYIADFAIHSENLIIEVDGEAHFTASGVEHDRKRDSFLAREGYRILRFSTGELDEAFEGCVEEILSEIGIS